MRWCGFLVLVACGRSPGPVDKPQSAAVAPVGFVEVQATEGRMRCANRILEEWEMSVDGSQVVATKQANLEPSRGPTPQFPLSEAPDLPGRRFTVAVTDGFIIGRNSGEWGGGLQWTSPDGTQRKVLGEENVHAVIDLGDAVLSLEGLSHLGIDEGQARWVARDVSGWKELAVAKLDGAAQAYARTGDVVFVLTTQGLTRLDPARTAKRVLALPTGGLYPDSGVADPAGNLWFGMRHFVVQLVPHGDTFTPHWFAPPSCPKLDVSSCACST